jgi:phospholipase A1
VKGLDFTPHRLNYFVVNGLPGDPVTQVKFQISAKYQVFEGDLKIFKRKVLPLYFAYTQKSFWNIGRPSAPFEENNYNPEVFLDYPVPDNALRLNHVIVSGEHESNGRDGSESRSWNRLCVRLSIAIETCEDMEKMGVLRKEKYSAYLKMWKVFGTEDQDDYLDSIGRGERFVEYAGMGEIGISIREIPLLSEISLLKNNQIDFRTRIPRDWGRRFYEIGYHQNVPSTNFFLYIQYWNGYGESLQRFDSRDARLKIGLSFFFAERRSDIG